MAATTTFDARAHWKIEAEVRIGEKQDSKNVGHRLQFITQDSPVAHAASCRRGQVYLPPMQASLP